LKKSLGKGTNIEKCLDYNGDRSERDELILQRCHRRAQKTHFTISKKGPFLTSKRKSSGRKKKKRSPSRLQGSVCGRQKASKDHGDSGDTPPITFVQWRSCKPKKTEDWSGLKTKRGLERL